MKLSALSKTPMLDLYSPLKNLIVFLPSETLSVCTCGREEEKNTSKVAQSSSETVSNTFSFPDSPPAQLLFLALLLYTSQKENSDVEGSAQTVKDEGICSQLAFYLVEAIVSVNTFVFFAKA
ncbi:hypothetical protein DNTS_008935 [Danionella cerebrum]|uniref:Uncharacterized protein n=1 Tax=Danionella cerebrum TaxID=2873325 RepID=A0A553Q2D3_9TELE|nr:hypothetical protein DNTS_008935 [Danionella translucida]